MLTKILIGSYIVCIVVTVCGGLLLAKTKKEGSNTFLDVLANVCFIVGAICLCVFCTICGPAYREREEKTVEEKEWKKIQADIEYQKQKN